MCVGVCVVGDRKVIEKEEKKGEEQCYMLSPFIFYTDIPHCNVMQYGDMRHYLMPDII